MEPRVEHVVTVTDNKYGLSTYKLRAKSGYASGVEVLAEMFGIKKTQVGYILNNQRWAQ